MTNGGSALLHGECSRDAILGYFGVESFIHSHDPVGTPPGVSTTSRLSGLVTGISTGNHLKKGGSLPGWGFSRCDFSCPPGQAWL
jgi:hypothetical protein